MEEEVVVFHGRDVGFGGVAVVLGYHDGDVILLCCLVVIVI